MISEQKAFAIMDFAHSSSLSHDAFRFFCGMVLSELGMPAVDSYALGDILGKSKNDVDRILQEIREGGWIETLERARS
jgi:hypothetical protein